MPEHADASAAPTRAIELLGRLGLELAFVEPGHDTGLLPINGFVMDLEELAQGDAPPGVRSGLGTARRWLDAILDGTGKFTAESIVNLNAWHAWMQLALNAWERGADLPATPGGWAATDARDPAPSDPKASPGRAPTPVPLPVPGADEPAIALNLAADSELLTEFHAESLELLQTIEQGVLHLEENPADAGTLNAIFRAFHTFKGGAGFLHLDALRDLAHDLESVLDAARRSELTITPETINVILAGADALKRFTQEIGAQLQGVNAGGAIVVPTRSVRDQARTVLRGGSTPSPSRSREPANGGGARPLPSQATEDLGEAREPTRPAESMVAAPGVEAHNSPPKPAAPRPSAAPASPAAVNGPSPTPPADGSARVESASGFVKLDTRKLDSLVDLVGELVIAQSMVVQDPDVQRLPSRHLARCLRQLRRITSELQRTAMSLRMVPIRRTFQKMARLVRDLSAQQHKQVQLVVEGEETELDRNIVEELGDPLVHMIRNAVDHGIEPPETRAARGKPRLGTIRLSAAHQRGGIVIRVQDDGNGLDRDRILAKARERRLVKPEATPSEAEIFALIFAPGFSTAERVTDVSGRGVGMDVVQRNIEKLRGKIEIQSVPGQGSSFTILLPLTLAIIDGMLVGVGKERYILPTLSVRESFRPRPGMVTTVHERGEVVSVRGRLTPLLRLGPHLGTPCRAVDPTDGIIVVVESGDAARGLLVDELLGKQEVVIKALGGTFRRQGLLAGAAILGDGRVGLILDVDTLVKCQRTKPPTGGDRAS